MSTIVERLIEAIWEHPARTLAEGTADAPITIRDRLLAAIWSADERTLTGDPPEPDPLAAGTLSEDSHDHDSATLSWTAATGGTAPIAAQLQRSAAGAGSWSDVSGATTSPHEDTGLSASTSYDYRVRWTDSADPAEVEYSNTVEVTTDPTPATSYAVAPRATVAIGAAFTLTLTADGDATGVEVTPSADAGTASPGTFSGTSATLSCTAPEEVGTMTISFTNDGDLADPAEMEIGVVEPSGRRPKYFPGLFRRPGGRSPRIRLFGR